MRTVSSQVRSPSRADRLAADTGRQTQHLATTVGTSESPSLADSAEAAYVPGEFDGAAGMLLMVTLQGVQGWASAAVLHRRLD